MLPVHLPIADITVDSLLVLGLGGGIGFLSGMFGVGGGFLMTPLLILIGVPHAMAIGASAAQTVGASVSGMMAHWRRGNVDVRMGTVLLAGGLAGSSFGVLLFGWLRALGQMELAVSLSYVLILGTVGLLMGREALGAWLGRVRGTASPSPRRRSHTWLHGMPLKMRFPQSRLYVSALLPFAIGAAVGVLTAIMGVGGGFIVVPAMIYLIGMPTARVVGTSLFQITFVTANVTFQQATAYHSVDIVLAILLLVGGVIGAQLGVRVGARLRGEALRGLLALMVLAVALALLWQLVATPEDLYSLELLEAG